MGGRGEASIWAGCPWVGAARSSREAGATMGEGALAGVTQPVECLLPKQNVVGSSPITRSLPRKYAGSRTPLATR